MGYALTLRWICTWHFVWPEPFSLSPVNRSLVLIGGKMSKSGGRFFKVKE
jgi:hypothetical protein